MSKKHFDKTYPYHNSSLEGYPAAYVAAASYILPLLLGFVRILGTPLGIFVWILPLYIYFKEKQSGLVQFHALQASMVYILAAILHILTNSLIWGLTLLSFGGLLLINPLLLFLLHLVISLLLPGLACYYCLRPALTYQEYSLPILGRLSHMILNKR